jgi:hypothetical protein
LNQAGFHDSLRITSFGGQVGAMVVGYNHNIMYKGEVFHVQTEDSGINNPHIITLLYRGGNILASKKTSYADIVRMGNLNQIVEDLMKEQHKEMLRRLKNAEFDERIGFNTVKQQPPLPQAVAESPPTPPQAPAPVQAQPESPSLGQETSSQSVPAASDKKQSLDDIIFNFLSAGDDSH